MSKTSNIIFSFLALFFIQHMLFAQTNCFRINYGTMGSELGNQIIQTANGDLWQVGTSGLGGTLGNEATVSRWDASGTVLFSRIYGANIVGPVVSDAGISIVESVDPAGGVIVAGFTNLFGPSLDITLYKLDLMGNIVWNRILTSPLSDVPVQLISTSDEQYVLLSTVFDSSTAGTEMNLIKFDDTGATTWDLTVGGANNDDAAGVVELPNGNFVAVGTRRGVTDDLFFANVDASGNYLGSFSLGTSTFDEEAAAIKLGTGINILTLGNITDPGSGMQNVMVSRVNGAGVDLTRRIFTPGRNSRASDLWRDASGKFLAVGSIDKSDSTTIPDSYLMRLDTDGSLLNTNRYGTPLFTNFFSVIRNLDGTISMFGNMFGVSGSTGQQDQFLAQTPSVGATNCCSIGPMGQEQVFDMVQVPYGAKVEFSFGDDTKLSRLDSGAVFPLCPAKAQFENAAVQASDFTLFPNPSTGLVQLEVPEDLLYGQLTITNLVGTKVWQGQIDQTYSELDLSRLEKGVYLVQLQRDGHQVTHRLVLQ